MKKKYCKASKYIVSYIICGLSMLHCSAQFDSTIFKNASELNRKFNEAYSISFSRNTPDSSGNGIFSILFSTDGKGYINSVQCDSSGTQTKLSLIIIEAFESIHEKLILKSGKAKRRMFLLPVTYSYYVMDKSIKEKKSAKELLDQLPTIKNIDSIAYETNAGYWNIKKDQLRHLFHFIVGSKKSNIVLLQQFFISSDPGIKI